MRWSRPAQAPSLRASQAPPHPHPPPRGGGLRSPVPLRPRTDKLTLKRYRPGGDEAFQPHFDSIDAVCARYLVFLWYLNDVAAGGETEFLGLDLKVAPRAGRLLMFPPYWMYQHAGLPPVSGDKYILSTYMLFST